MSQVHNVTHVPVHSALNLKYYAAGRIIFKAKGRDSKFGWLQAPATIQICYQSPLGHS